MADHVLVAVNDSDPATDALEFAFDEYGDARLTALTVFDPTDLIVSTLGQGGWGADGLQAAAKEEAEEILEEARARGEERGVDVECELARGEPADAILEYVEEADVDHVVIGSHGRSGVSRILLGSVAERVVRRSPTPVTVVR